ncbi:hypothetical protein ISN44_As10g018080 [Arabidopsis suecica]|uniref:Uncharacterized protein n=1 Tax=Arabidopsis suecica TaxID=45249 RepID=A0A8T2A074_ARASU|nr:hypothetical protein ISN44_As10g018080 [Arabidopsis suecica]
MEETTRKAETPLDLPQNSKSSDSDVEGKGRTRRRQQFYLKRILHLSLLSVLSLSCGGEWLKSQLKAVVMRGDNNGETLIPKKSVGIRLWSREIVFWRDNWAYGL